MLLCLSFITPKKNLEVITNYLVIQRKFCWEMAKRKRGEQITSGRIRENPFHPVANRTLESTAASIFLDVLVFLDQSSDTKLQRDSGGRLISASLQPKLESILDFLGTYSSGSESLSKQDISNLLIPWATKCLLFLAAGERADARDLDILWNILVQSMDAIITSEDDLTYLSQALSTQVLNKLAPFAVESAVSASKASIRMHASRAFALFTDKIYRPSFDLYCGVILVDLVTQVVGAAVLKEWSSCTSSLRSGVNYFVILAAPTDIAEGDSSKPKEEVPGTCQRACSVGFVEACLDWHL
jgi:hypothetical protein